MVYYNTQVGNLDEETLQRNIDAVESRHGIGLTDYNKEIEQRLREIRFYINYNNSTKNYATKKNNNRRIEYYFREIDELIKRRDNNK